MKSQKKILYKEGMLTFSVLKTRRGNRVFLDMGADAVLIIPRLKDGRYVLTKQVRIGKRAAIYEFPSGGIKEGESIEKAAKRELHEEVGATGKMTFLCTVEPLSGIVKFNLHIFLAEMVSMAKDNRRLEQHEAVSLEVLSKKQLLKKIDSLNIVDGYLFLGMAALLACNRNI